MFKKITITLFLLCLMVLPSRVLAGKFSLFGVSLGMTRAEVDKAWKPEGKDRYTIKNSTIFDITTRFDHQDKLFSVSFSAPLPLEIPEDLAGQAFQNFSTRMWASSNVSVSTRMGRGSFKATITDTNMQKAYTETLENFISVIFRP